MWPRDKKNQCDQISCKHVSPYSVMQINDSCFQNTDCLPRRKRGWILKEETNTQGWCTEAEDRQPVTAGKNGLLNFESMQMT